MKPTSILARTRLAKWTSCEPHSRFSLGGEKFVRLWIVHIILLSGPSYGCLCLILAASRVHDSPPRILASLCSHYPFFERSFFGACISEDQFLANYLEEFYYDGYLDQISAKIHLSKYHCISRDNLWSSSSSRFWCARGRWLRTGCEGLISKPWQQRSDSFPFHAPANLLEETALAAFVRGVIYLFIYLFADVNKVHA